jgi:hypothetical protein
VKLVKQDLNASCAWGLQGRILEGVLSGGFTDPSPMQKKIFKFVLQAGSILSNLFKMCNLRNKNGEYKAKHFLQFSPFFVSFEAKEASFLLKIGRNRLILEGLFSPNIRPESTDAQPRPSRRDCRRPSTALSR